MTDRNEAFSPSGRESSTGDCHWVLERLHAFVEGESAPLVEKLIEEHLSTCAECREHVEELKLERLWLIEAAVESPALPGRFAEKVTRRIEKAVRTGHSRRRRAALLRASGVAAAAVLVVAAFVLRSGPGVGPSSTPPALVSDLSPATHQAAESSVSASAGLATESPGSNAVGETPHFVVVTPVTLPEPEQRSGAIEQSFSSGPSGFAHVAVMFRRLDQAERPLDPALRDDPCKPDPNKDGKTDITDVAYSCQLLLAGQPPRPFDVAESKPLEPVDCGELCFRA